MAVAIVMEFEGATLDQYDQVIERMGLTPGGEGAPHALSHWVTETDNGIRVTDVWRSREEFEKFAEEQIGPFTREAGIEGPPEMTFHEVHSYLTPGPVA
jgi:hypothetical protein